MLVCFYIFFPIKDNRKIVISKICIGILSNIFAFINTNFLIISISNNIYEFILLEIVLIVYIIAISIIQTEIDINSMELKWIDIKNLFQNGHYLKICKPFFILTTLDIAYGVIMGATLLYKYGKVDIRSLQKILGHENISTTTIYTHVDDEDIRNAIRSNPLNK